MDLINNKRHPKYYDDIEKRREYLKTQTVIDLPNEYWVDIGEFEGYYKISSFFRIKSVCRLVDNGRNGTILKPEQLIRPAKNSDGYFCACLTKNKISTTFSLHVLEAIAFVPNPLNLPEVNHEDGNKLNCLPSNLVWNTHKQNMEHSVKTGLRKYVKGINNGKYKIPKDKVIEIFKSSGGTLGLSKKYGVTKCAISRIRNGKTYKSLTDGINRN